MPSLIDIALRAAEGATRTVFDRVGTMLALIRFHWAMSSQTFRHLGAAHRIYAEVHGLWSSRGPTIFTQAFGAIKHVITHTIPSALGWGIKHLLSPAEHLALGLFHGAEHLITGVFNVLWKALKGEVSFLLGFIRNVIKWARDAVNWVIKYGPRVVELLWHPKRIVAFILGDLIAPLLAFMLRHSAPIFRLLFRGLWASTLLVGHALEDVLADVL